MPLIGHYVPTIFFILVVFAVFLFFSEIADKEWKKIRFGRFTFKFPFTKYMKVGLIYFPILFFVSWSITEQMDRNVSVRLGSGSAGYEMIQAYNQIFVAFVFTAIVYLGVRFFKDPRKIKALMIALFILLLLFVIPQAIGSHNNKMKLYEQIDEIEKQGVGIERRSYYFAGKTNPIDYENLTEVIELAKANNLTLFISNGSPAWHFLTVPEGPIEIWFWYELAPQKRVSMIKLP